jgi:two-component system response regulator AtoC
MRQALELARRTARSEAAAVLLVGESGVGKELMASYIHENSSRAQGPFVRINVAAIPDSMIEAELFGSVRGSFTDAKRDREGFFASAHRGTLLLDEIGELKPELQAKLLRAIETKRFYPVGASREVFSDVRIIAATNRDPVQAVNAGALRADLYYRLATVVVRIPPLRERPEDIGDLARSLLRASDASGTLSLDEQAAAALVRYPWPGNVRELRNLLERATILSDGPVITLDLLARAGFFPISPSPSSAGAAAASLPRVGRLSLAEVAQAAAEEAERSYIRLVMEETRQNRTRAAAVLGISRSTLWQKLRKYGLENGPAEEGWPGHV